MTDLSSIRVCSRCYAAVLLRGDSYRSIWIAKYADPTEWSVVSFDSQTQANTHDSFMSEEWAFAALRQKVADWTDEGFEVAFAGTPTEDVGRLLNRDGRSDEKIVMVLREMLTVEEAPSRYVN